MLKNNYCRKKETSQNQKPQLPIHQDKATSRNRKFHKIKADIVASTETWLNSNIKKAKSTGKTDRVVDVLLTVSNKKPKL